MKKSSSVLKKIIALCIVSFVVAFLLGLSIWSFRPMIEIPPSVLLPATTFSFFYLNLDSKNSGITELLDNAKNEILNSEIGRVKKSLVKLAFSASIPNQLAGFMTLGEGAQEPELVFIISMGKIIRLVKLFGRPFDRAVFQGLPVEKEREGRHSFKHVQIDPEGTGASAYSIIGNNIVIGTSLLSVKDCLNTFKENVLVDVEPAYRYLSELLSQTSSEKDGFLYVDNSERDLSRIFKFVEQKYAFAAFPSVDEIVTITGDLHILTETEAINGGIIFYCRGYENISEVRSDVKFLYGAMRRKFKPYDINLKGNIDIEGDTVIFNFYITNYMEAILSHITSDGGDE